ncbi:MAG: hypothetical protein WCI37_00680 [bacterium]
MENKNINPTSNQNNTTPQPTPQNPAPVMGGIITPQPTPQNPAPKKLKHKKLIIFLIILILLIGGGIGFYFLYWMNPAVMWSRSLNSLGFAYGKAADYSLQQTTTKYAGLHFDGNLTATSGKNNYSGKIIIDTYNKNTQTNLDINIGLDKVNLNEMSIEQPNSSIPDVYLNISGYKKFNVGTLLGLDNNAANSIDGQWVKIDQSLIGSAINSQSMQIKNNSLSSKDIAQTVKDLESVNKKYIFNSDKKYAVTKILKNYGYETIDGHRTYHYKIGFNKENVKNYITDLSSQLTTTPLGKWTMQKYNKPIDKLINTESLKASADKINDSDSVDVWIDSSLSYIYRVRISDSKNPTINYLDTGLEFNNFSQIPFYINFNSSSDGTTSKLVAKTIIDTKKQTISGNLQYTISGQGDSTSVNLNTNFNQSNKKLTLIAPTKYITLKQALNQLGLGADYDQLVTNLSESGGLQGILYNTLIGT